MPPKPPRFDSSKTGEAYAHPHEEDDILINMQPFRNPHQERNVGNQNTDEEQENG
jgi:hypothetical protein